MARNNRIFDAGKLRVDHMKVGPANPARAHHDANFSLARVRVCPLLHLERRPRGRQHHRTHSRFSGWDPIADRIMHTARSWRALDLDQGYGRITHECVVLMKINNGRARAPSVSVKRERTW